MSPTRTSSGPSAISLKANDVCPCAGESGTPATTRCAAFFPRTASFHFSFTKTESGRDAPLKQDMVEVVGWISDAQKVAMVPKMSDVARDDRSAAEGLRQTEGSKSTDRRHVLGNVEVFSLIRRSWKKKRSTLRERSLRLKRSKPCPRQRPAEAVTRCSSQEER